MKDPKGPKLFAPCILEKCIKYPACINKPTIVCDSLYHFVLDLAEYHKPVEEILRQTFKEVNMVLEE